MSTSRSNPGGLTQPRCPTCGGSSFSFIEVSGPANTVVHLKQELAALQERFEAHGADLWKEFPEGAGKVVDAAHLEEVAFEALSESSSEPKKKQHHIKLEGVQREFAEARERLLARLRQVEQNVAMVYCCGCGLLVGSVASPLRDADSITRLEHGLAEVRDAVTQLSRNLSEAFALLREQLTHRKPG